MHISVSCSHASAIDLAFFFIQSEWWRRPSRNQNIWTACAYRGWPPWIATVDNWRGSPRSKAVIGRALCLHCFPRTILVLSHPDLYSLHVLLASHGIWHQASISRHTLKSMHSCLQGITLLALGIHWLALIAYISHTCERSSLEIPTRRAYEGA